MPLTCNINGVNKNGNQKTDINCQIRKASKNINAFLSNVYCTLTESEGFEQFI